MAELERLKTYARIDGTDEDALLLSLLAAAESAVRDMTGKAPPGGQDELYDVAVLLLAAHWHENRTPVSETAAAEVPFTLQMLLNHIALSSRYPEGGESPGPDE